MTAPGPQRVDQLMAGVATGDATSRAAFLIRDHLRQLGYASDIYAEAQHIMPSCRDTCRTIDTYTGGPDDIILHHFGLWSDITDTFIRLPGPKVLIYHNITPGHFFRGYHDATAQQLDASRARLPEVLQACRSAWAVSKYNATELRPLAPRPVQVFPLPFSSDGLDVPPDAARLQRLTAPLQTVLSVGRIAPNKNLEELIRAFALYQRAFNPFSRLMLVGSDRSAPRYVTYLRELVRALGVANVCFEGFVWPDALAAYYRLADLYVTTSNHEGYCLPLLEAMHYELPVMAKRTGGTPEAMQNAGVLFEDLAPAELAALMHTLLTDHALHDKVRTSQRQRLTQESQRNLSEELQRLLLPLF